MSKNDLHQRGFSAALSSKCSVEGMINNLESIHDEALEAQTNSNEEHEDIEQLNLLIKTTRYEEGTLKKRIASIKLHLSSKEKRLERLELSAGQNEQEDEYNEIRKQYPAFTIGSVIFTLITLFLVFFYASLGFGVIYKSFQTTTYLINPMVFTDALDLGGGALAFTLLFPFLFMGAGFMLFVLISKKGNQRHLLVTPLTLTFTFLFESILSYQTVADLYRINYANGMYNDPWQFHFIFFEPNFYLMLFLGFVVYILWGFLLNYLINHPYRNHSSLSFHDQQELIIQCTEQVLELNQNLHKMNNKLTDLQSTILQLETKSINLKSQKIIPSADQNKLEENIYDFIQGYMSYATNALKNDSLQLELLIQRKNEWLNRYLNKKV